MIAQEAYEGCAATGFERNERGFSLTELMIAMMVFTLIMGSVVGLLIKSQKIFRTEQGVSEMDQNARLMIDFLTRDIQQSKENALGLGSNFRSIYSYNGPEGKTDEVTIISSDTETKIPAAALPLIGATPRPFSALDHYVEILPNGQGHLEIEDVHANLKPNEEFIISATLQDGSTQFDFVKVTGARITPEGTLGLSFNPVEHKGVQPEVPYGSVYEDGVFTMRPVSIKRYYIDREDKQHPHFALSVNGGEPIAISRNVVAFQLRYLEQQQGEIEGRWVKEQSIARGTKTLAVEVTMTARTEIAGDPEAERLVTLASVVRPRFLPGDAFGSSGGSRNPGFPGEGGGGGDEWGNGGDGGDGGDGAGGGPGGGPGGGGPGGTGRGPGDNGFGGPGFGGGGGGFGDGSGSGGAGFGSGGYRHETRRIGRDPKLGQRLTK